MVPLPNVPRLLLCLLVSFPALAASHVWTGATDDHFSNASNWIGGSPAGDASAEISFPASSRQTATNDLNGLTVQSIAFSAGGFTIGGNAITLANATLIDTSMGTNMIACDFVLAGDMAVSVSGSVYDSKGLTLSGTISGNGGVSLRGGGHLIYAGSQPNSYNGLTRVLYGELQLTKAANVTAIAGDLDVEDDGANNEYGRIAILSDEQIAIGSHVTLGQYATFACPATESLGPLTLIRGAMLMTGVANGGVTTLTGTVVLTGDIEIGGTVQGDINASGTFLLDGVRTIHANASYGQLRMAPGQKSAGSGIVLTGGTYSPGNFSDVLTFTQATYDGPTTIQGGNVSINAPQSAVDLQNGGYAGQCKSLAAEAGVVSIHNYPATISQSDVRLSPSVTVGLEVGAAMQMTGTLDLGGAALRIDRVTDFIYGRTYKVVNNTSTHPVIGTFANLPEGSMVANRYRISYVGGDGNDITLTDGGLVPASMGLTLSPYNPRTGNPTDITAFVSTSSRMPTGTVTFTAGSTALGSAPLDTGVAKLTAGASLPPGRYTVTGTYSGDSYVAPASATADLCVGSVTPAFTSIDPPTVTAGVKATLTAHGSNFTNLSYVVIGSSSIVATFVSPTELRFDYTPFASPSDYQIDVYVSQQDQCGSPESARVKLNVTGATPSSPFTFVAPTATLTGVTPGAMTFWLAALRGAITYYAASIVNDTDRDGIVSLTVPRFGSSGLWLVADLNAHTLAYDGPTHNAPAASSFPPKPFLRDSNGHYTHIRFPASIYTPTVFGWARPGAGGWMMVAGDHSPLSDEDGAQNGSVTFETSAMTAVDGTTAAPPGDGLQPGDMFLVIGDEGRTWWGDIVDGHLAESNGAGKLGFPAAASIFRETDGSAKVLIERFEGTDGAVSVQYATADDTLVAGRNYVAQAGTATFGAGEIFKTISIPLIDDHAYSGQSQFKVNLSNPSGASIGNATTNVIVLDDDAPPVLSIDLPASSIQEGDAGEVDIPIPVRLTGATTLPVTVNWAWSEGSGASHGGLFQFAPGETEKTITVSYIANTTPEPDRIITILLSNPHNATAPTVPAILTIVDDDFAGVSVADASVLENAGKVLVPLQLSRSSLKPITVTFETRDLSAVAGSDYVATSSTMTVSSVSSITVPILNNSVPGQTKAFEVVLTSVTGGKLDRSTATVTIVDDDGAPPTSAPPSRHRGVRH